MTFLALDVETANFDVSSICELGIANYNKDELIGEWQSLLNPEVAFNQKNISIHGITAADVADAPCFRNVVKSLHNNMEGQVIISHTTFDQSALQKAFYNCGYDLPECIWVDSAEVARTAWPQYSQRGYGLANICDMIGHDFDHHAALEDAKAAAQVIFAAMRHMDCTFQDIVDIGHAPITKKNYKKSTPPQFTSNPKIEGNPNGELYGHQIVFTGQLSMSRDEAAQLAASKGCKVHPTVTKKTTILVVGTQDISQLAGHKKSSKQRKAEEYIQKGVPIKIIKENTFMEYIIA